MDGTLCVNVYSPAVNNKTSTANVVKIKGNNMIPSVMSLCKLNAQGFTKAIYLVQIVIFFSVSNYDIHFAA